MKKTYEKPELQVEQFDVEDIITVSGGDLLQTVGGVNEMMTDLGNINSAPGTD